MKKDKNQNTKHAVTKISKESTCTNNTVKARIIKDDKKNMRLVAPKSMLEIQSEIAGISHDIYGGVTKVRLKGSGSSVICTVDKGQKVSAKSMVGVRRTALYSQLARIANKDNYDETRTLVLSVLEQSKKTIIKNGKKVVVEPKIVHLTAEDAEKCFGISSDLKVLPGKL